MRKSPPIHKIIYFKLVEQNQYVIVYAQYRNIGKPNNLKSIWEQYTKDHTQDSQYHLKSPMSEGGEP
jgi:hypothetical protein